MELRDIDRYIFPELGINNFAKWFSRSIGRVSNCGARRSHGPAEVVGALTDSWHL